MTTAVSGVWLRYRLLSTAHELIHTVLPFLTVPALSGLPLVSRERQLHWLHNCERALQILGHDTGYEAEEFFASFGGRPACGTVSPPAAVVLRLSLDVLHCTSSDAADLYAVSP